MSMNDARMLARIRILEQQVADVTRERDSARATNRYYEEALYIPGIRPYTVLDGDTAVEIKPERVAELITALAAARRTIEFLDRSKSKG